MSRSYCFRSVVSKSRSGCFRSVLSRSRSSCFRSVLFKSRSICFRSVLFRSRSYCFSNTMRLFLFCFTTRPWWSSRFYRLGQWQHWTSWRIAVVPVHDWVPAYHELDTTSSLGSSLSSTGYQLITVSQSIMNWVPAHHWLPAFHQLQMIHLLDFRPLVTVYDLITGRRFMKSMLYQLVRSVVSHQLITTITSLYMK